jgi:RimJ/RimL family protein N-acetyltransferase
MHPQCASAASPAWNWLAEQYPFAPYAFYRDRAPREAFAALACEWVREVMATASGRFEAGSGGLACWRKLAWDSEQFGFPAARIDALIAAGDYHEARTRAAWLVAEVVADCSAAGVRHLTARLDAGDLAAQHALESTGFELIDGIQTFSLVSAPQVPANSTIQARLFQPEDLEPLLAIARQAYTFDRFHADAALGAGVADAANEAWIRNSCLGQAADAVVVAVAEGEPVGYVTCQLDRRPAALLGGPLGRIVMVATAARARGRGVAREATACALNWFARQGAVEVEVGTQLRNVAAGRLYESCGFRLSGVSLTFRKILEGVPCRTVRNCLPGQTAPLVRN